MFPYALSACRGCNHEHIAFGRHLMDQWVMRERLHFSQAKAVAQISGESCCGALVGRADALAVKRRTSAIRKFTSERHGRSPVDALLAVGALESADWLANLAIFEHRSDDLPQRAAVHHARGRVHLSLHHSHLQVPVRAAAASNWHSARSAALSPAATCTALAPAWCTRIVIRH